MTIACPRVDVSELRGPVANTDIGSLAMLPPHCVGRVSDSAHENC